MQTVCIQSQDCVGESEAGSAGTWYDFEVPLPGVKRGPMGIKLASFTCSGPQRTIEAPWNTLYVRESTTLTTETHVIQIELAMDGRRVTIPVVLPLHVNDVLAVQRDDSEHVTLHMTHPHGMSGGTLHLLDGPVWWATTFGHFNIAAMEPSFSSDTSITINIALSDEQLVAAKQSFRQSVCTANVSGPTQLLRLLQAATDRELKLHDLPSLDITWRCAPELNRTTMQCTAGLDCVIRIAECGLLKTMGFMGAIELKCEGRGTANRERCDYRCTANSEQRDDRGTANSEQLEWSCARLPPGWYYPSHRPLGMGVYRFMQEAANKLNGLYFCPKPVSNNSPPGTAHFFTIRLVSNMLVPVTIMAGKYTPPQLCIVIQKGIDAALSKGQITITYADDRIHFVSTDDMPFELDFREQKVNFDADMIGFQPTKFAGRSRYVSTSMSEKPWDLQLIYQVDEVPQSKRFRISAAYESGIAGIIEQVQGYEVSLRTFSAGSPFHCNFRPGDVVLLGAGPAESEFFVKNSEQQFTRVTKGASTASSPVMAIVKSTAFEPGVVVLHCGQAAKLSNVDSGGGWLCLGTLEKPSMNLCFADCMRNVLKGHMLGFPDTTIEVSEHGHDGGTATRHFPLMAPFPYALDHPDYLLLRFESSASAYAAKDLLHISGRSSTNPFAHVMCFPNVREGAVPSATVMIKQGTAESLKFRLHIENPDGSGYVMHGSRFCFALHMISPQ